MKKHAFAGLVMTIVVLSSFTAIAPGTWSLDKAHSKLGFSITHLMISDVEGSFKITEATIRTTREDFTDAVVTMTADVNSVNTENEDRDIHLKKPDFFDATKFPVISFKSTSFTKVDEKNYVVKGDLALHGVTRPVVLNAKASIGTNPMSKKTVAGFKITGTIKRTDFGIAAETPSAMLSDDVNIVANVEFARD